MRYQNLYNSKCEAEDAKKSSENADKLRKNTPKDGYVIIPGKGKPPIYNFYDSNVSNVNDVRDVYVYLNNKKVFYSLNRNSGQQDKNTEFHFQTEVNLDTGNNQISIFSRSRSGFTYERRLRIFRRQ